MPDLTFIIPIGPAHQQLAERAIASAESQTVPCEILYLLDEARRGPGVLRNLMLQQAQTEFVTFLDADDWIEPTFAEETIAEYRRIGGDRYIFTNWFDTDNQVVQAPCINGPDGYPVSMLGRRPYCGGTWHVITTLIPTEWARAAGGFDESLPAVEDTDFYLRLCTTFRCAHHLARPLFHYTPGGGRARDFHHGPDYHRVMRDLSLRYGGRMGCCGDDQKVAAPIGQRQESDVLAMALWQGNRTEYGRVTRRIYPRISSPRTAWVDPRDAAAMPMLWRVIEQPRPVESARVDQRLGFNSLEQIAQAGMATVVKQPYAPPAFEPPVPPVEARPDVSRVVRLGQQAAAKAGEPIFVFPEKEYPSYADIKQLVNLSGFDAVTTKQIDAFNRRPYIVISPEPIPDLNGLRAQIICWQLEYAGDYQSNYKGFTGEVWASDKAWADTNGAKYVLMGSHPGLADGEPLEPYYDVTLLGYMTPRRQAIKDALADLRWPMDYPGHGTTERDTILLRTRVMLHVHQHDHAPYCAPQRIAIAAAHHLPVISETVIDPGDLADYVAYVDYADIPEAARAQLASDEGRVMASRVGEKLHNYLCVERTFRAEVERALKS